MSVRHQFVLDKILATMSPESHDPATDTYVFKFKADKSDTTLRIEARKTGGTINGERHHFDILRWRTEN